MKASLISLLLALFLVSTLALDAPSDFFSREDGASLSTHLIDQLERRQEGAELREDDYYAIATLASLQSVPSSFSKKLCGQAKSLEGATKAISPKIVHRTLGIVSALGCGDESKPSAATLSALAKNLIDSLHQDYTAVEDFHAALSALQLINKSAPSVVSISSKVAAQVAERITDLMDPHGYFRADPSEEEGTLGHSGHALHALAMLKQLAALKSDAASNEALEHIKSTVEPITQLLVDADEENRDIIEFDDPHNPLRATALLWIGTEALARVGLPIQVTASQITKLAQYFVQHKGVNNAGDAYHLLRALKTIANNTWKKSPLVVTFPVTSILAASKGEDSLLKIRVTDVFGNFATKAHIYINRVYPVTNQKQVILHNQQAALVSDKPEEILYSFNLLAAKPDQGLYLVDMAVTSQDKDSPFFSASEVSRSVKVVVVAELSDVSIQVVDAPEEEDQELAYKVSYPDKVPDTLRGNQLQHVLVSFRVRSQGRPLPVQQAFVVLRHEMSGHEAILTAHLTGNKYKIHLDIGAKAAQVFNNLDGKYSVHLLVGDAFLHRPFFWHFADINLNLAKREASIPNPKGLKPEIHHQFRQAEKRPPPAVSLTFSGLVVGVPLLFLIIGLALTGANIKNFPTSGSRFLSAVGFLSCIIAILGLYVLYWFQLNMIETLIYLGGLGVVTIFIGWRALRHRLEARMHSKKD